MCAAPRSNILLVTFSCKAWADITMFGDVAVRLLNLMGHSGTVPSALLADDIPAALDKLKAAVEENKTSVAAKVSDEESEEQPVSLAVRAHPLIEMLTAAAKEKCDVMWDS